MGFGDTLLASGEARKIHKETGQPVLIVDRMGHPVKSDLFNGVPYILQRPSHAGPYQKLKNCPGHRSYIAAKSPERWRWRPYTPTPAEIVFTADELAFAEPHRGAIMLEPYGKAIGHDNKLWPLTYWSHLDCAIHAARLGRVVQAGPPGTRPLLHAQHVATPTFRHALALLAVCRAFVGTEGGLMHGAAAVGTPAVIIWSEFISPDITGYESHVNLRKAGEPCGMRIDCKTCRESMFAIEPSDVIRSLKGLL